MASGATHAVGRQRWRIAVGSEELALALRPRFGDWNRRSWLGRLAAVFDRLDSGDRHLRIDRLELDLGVVVVPQLDGPSLQALERTLGDRLVERLAQELRGRLGARSSTVGHGAALGSEIKIVSVGEAQLEVFELFLLRGVLPFWVPRRSFRFDELMRRLSESSPREVVGVIRRHGHRQSVLDRLVAQLDRESFHQLLHLLEPTQAALLVAYLLDIEQLHRHRPLIAMSSRRLGHSVAVLTLAYLVNDRGSWFNRRSYVRSLILGLARARGVPYPDLLRTIGRCLEWVTMAKSASRSQPLFRSSLPALLRELLAELDEPEAVPRGSGSVDRLRHEILDHLPTSYAAASRGPGSISETDLGAMLLALTEHHPPSARRFLRSLRLRHSERRALVQESTAEVFGSMMGLLVPEEAGALHELAEVLGRVPSPYRPRGAQIRDAILVEVLAAGPGQRLTEDILGRILRRLFESPLPDPVARSLDLEIRRVPARLPEASRTVLRLAVAQAAGQQLDGPELPEDTQRAVQGLGPSQGVEAEKARSRLAGPRSSGSPSQRERPEVEAHGVLERVSRRRERSASTGEEIGTASPEPEALYLDNAGLVLVGPFLPRLLEQLDVFEEGKVRDLDCASRAVHLLQYLADGRLDASEPELVLPKVLCGWPVEEPVTASLDPMESHLALCDSLLGALVQRWPSLRGSSTEALQQTFLQREGRLKLTESENRLVVERSSLDVLMEDLPWSFSWILHDAMDRPLQVSW